MTELNSLKILMLCPYPLKLTLGGAKVYIEAANSYRDLGHEVTLIGGDEFVDLPAIHPEFLDEYAKKIKAFIQRKGSDFDVVEFEYLYLPFNREEFSKDILLVARSILLELHLKKIKIPKFNGLRSFAGSALYGVKRRRNLERRLNNALQSLRCADFVNVPNPLDKKVLIESGVSKEKVGVAPYGMSSSRREALLTKRAAGDTFEIAFVGTFDPRKGAVEFPKLWSEIKKSVPHAKLKLLGTSAMFPDSESVKKTFPQKLRSSIEVVEKFKSEDLPELLKESSCGIFPSHLESFGFGVLEMMAASLPVSVYETPGPEMLVPPEWQSRRGDYKALAEIVIGWAKDQDILEKAQRVARERAATFTWEVSSKAILEEYLAKITERMTHQD